MVGIASPYVTVCDEAVTVRVALLKVKGELVSVDAAL
jgi:hypothetical protein